VDVVVCADSVQGGRHYDAPAVRAALKMLQVPEVAVTVHAGPLRTVRETYEQLSEVVGARPDLVVVSHGGAECLLLRPGAVAPNGRPTTTGIPYGQHATAAQAVRRALRRLPPVRLALRLARGPIRPLMAKDEFERTYRSLVRQLLDSTEARLVLLESCGGDDDYAPNEAGRTEHISWLLGDLAAAAPDRVVVVDPKPLLHRWDDFAGDRAHLRSSGHDKTAQAIATELLRAGWLGAVPQPRSGLRGQTVDTL
jgi:hypothetical protein